uniref:chondrolectin-like n=1 Tax=Gasterosteus aculeatus aculeatus TaxID=481459 RepID=UPI001A98F292|nr:chondrolectin-like [Gasterosteus aculeatus aculeatus]
MADYDHVAWIGLYNDVASWRWSLSNASFYRPGEAQFRRWGPGEGSNNYKYYTCMYADGSWMDYPPEASFRSVCFDAGGLNETFIFINISMKWTEAQTYCRDNHTDLASVRNLAENQKIQDLVPSQGIVWIGLFRDGWKWSHGTHSSFTNWKQGEPKLSEETCVAANFSADGQWQVSHCQDMRPFICYTDVPVSKQVIKVRLQKSSSSVDLNDPVVMENMLEKLKQRLKDQGLDDHIQLSWKKQPDGKVFHKEEKKTQDEKTCPEKDEL